MLTLGRGVTSSYYSSSASSYYTTPTGGIEPKGLWVMPTGEFGLVDAAPIDDRIFALLLDEATDPHTGEKLVRDPPGTMKIRGADGIERVPRRRNPGFDLTFSPPKSVDVAWVLATPERRMAWEAIQERAVRRTIAYLQNVAAFCRRGRNGTTLETTTLLGATFQHGDARPTQRRGTGAAAILDGADHDPDSDTTPDLDTAPSDALSTDGELHEGWDPLESDSKSALDGRSAPKLHTHFVLFNLGHRADGTWGAVDGRYLYNWKMAMGAVYRAEFAHLAATELGVAIDVTNAGQGLYEVAGVPDAIRDAMSPRRAEIQAAMDKVGFSTAQAPRLTDATARKLRSAKDTADEDAQSRFNRWIDALTDLGFGRDEAHAAIYERALTEADVLLRDTIFDAALRDLPTALTEKEGVIGPQRIVAHVAALAVAAGRNADAIEQTVAGFLASGRLVRVTDAAGQEVTDDIGQPLYTDPDLIAAELAIVKWAASSTADTRFQLPEDAITAALANTTINGNHLTLNREQSGGLRHLTTKSGTLMTIEGAAGAGKTTVLAFVAEAYRRAGAPPLPGSLPLDAAGPLPRPYRILGAAAPWKTALDLATEIGIEPERDSRALAQWFADWDRGRDIMDDRTIIMVDEAGKVGSRDMDRLRAYAQKAGAKVILAGDLRQQLAVSAGPAMALVAWQTGRYRMERSQRMQVNPDDVLIHLHGLTRTDAIAAADALTPDERAALMTKDNIQAVVDRIEALRSNDASLWVRASDILVHRDGLPRADAETKAAALEPWERAALIRDHGATLLRAYEVWTRQAAADMSYGRTTDACRVFADHGRFVWTPTAEDALVAAVDGWKQFLFDRGVLKPLEPGAPPPGPASLLTADTAIVTVRSNDEMRKANGMMRAVLRDCGALTGDDTRIAVINRSGDRQIIDIAVGEQIRFLRKDRDIPGIFNGLTARVLKVTPTTRTAAMLEVRIPDGRHLTIDSATMMAKGRKSLEHLYAVNVSESQGATTGANFVTVDPTSSTNEMYVAISRAKRLTMLYAASEGVDLVMKDQFLLTERGDIFRRLRQVDIRGVTDPLTAVAEAALDARRRSRAADPPPLLVAASDGSAAASLAARLNLPPESARSLESWQRAWKRNEDAMPEGAIVVIDDIDRFRDPPPRRRDRQETDPRGWQRLKDLIELVHAARGRLVIGGDLRRRWVADAIAREQYKTTALDYQFPGWRDHLDVDRDLLSSDDAEAAWAACMAAAESYATQDPTAPLDLDDIFLSSPSTEPPPPDDTFSPFIINGADLDGPLSADDIYAAWDDAAPLIVDSSAVDALAPPPDHLEEEWRQYDLFLTAAPHPGAPSENHTKDTPPPEAPYPETDPAPPPLVILRRPTPDFLSPPLSPPSFQRYPAPTAPSRNRPPRPFRLPLPPSEKPFGVATHPRLYFAAIRPPTPPVFSPGSLPMPRDDTSRRPARAGTPRYDTDQISADQRRINMEADLFAFLRDKGYRNLTSRPIPGQNSYWTASNDSKPGDGETLSVRQIGSGWRWTMKNGSGSGDALSIAIKLLGMPYLDAWKSLREYVPGIEPIRQFRDITPQEREAQAAARQVAEQRQQGKTAAAAEISSRVTDWLTTQTAAGTPVPTQTVEHDGARSRDADWPAIVRNLDWPDADWSAIADALDIPSPPPDTNDTNAPDATAHADATIDHRVRILTAADGAVVAIETALTHQRATALAARLTPPSETISPNYLERRGITRDTQYAYRGTLGFNTHGAACFTHTLADGTITGYEYKGDGMAGFTKGEGGRHLALFGNTTAPARVVIIETGVDVLSRAQENGCPEDTLYVSSGGTPGTASIARLRAILAANPDAAVEIGTDRDRGGHDQAATWMEALAGHPGGVTRTLPPHTRDWNNEVRLAAGILTDHAYLMDLVKAEPPLPPPPADHPLHRLHQSYAAPLAAVRNAITELESKTSDPARQAAALDDAATAVARLTRFLDTAATRAGATIDPAAAETADRSHAAAEAALLAVFRDAYGPQAPAALRTFTHALRGHTDATKIIADAVRAPHKLAPIPDGGPYARAALRLRDLPAAWTAWTQSRDAVLATHPLPSVWDINEARAGSHPGIAAAHATEYALSRFARATGLPSPWPTAAGLQTLSDACRTTSAAAAVARPLTPEAPQPGTPPFVAPAPDPAQDLAPTLDTLPSQPTDHESDSPLGPEPPQPMDLDATLADIPSFDIPLPDAPPLDAADLEPIPVPDQDDPDHEPVTPDGDIPSLPPSANPAISSLSPDDVAAQIVAEAAANAERATRDSQDRRLRRDEARVEATRIDLDPPQPGERRSPSALMPGLPPTPPSSAPSTLTPPAPGTGEAATVGDDYGISSDPDAKDHNWLRDLGRFYETHLSGKFEKEIAWTRINKASQEVVVQFRDNSRFRDNGRALLLDGDGKATPDKAAFIIEVAAARGMKELWLRGDHEFRLDLARECHRCGITVRNPELRTFMADLDRTEPRDLDRIAAEQANTGAARRAAEAPAPTAESPLSPTEASPASDAADPSAVIEDEPQPPLNAEASTPDSAIDPNAPPIDRGGFGANAFIGRLRPVRNSATTPTITVPDAPLSSLSQADATPSSDAPSPTANPVDPTEPVAIDAVDRAAVDLVAALRAAAPAITSALYAATPTRDGVDQQIDAILANLNPPLTVIVDPAQDRVHRVAALASLRIGMATLSQTLSDPAAAGLDGIVPTVAQPLVDTLSQIETQVADTQALLRRVPDIADDLLAAAETTLDATEAALARRHLMTPEPLVTSLQAAHDTAARQLDDAMAIHALRYGNADAPTTSSITTPDQATAVAVRIHLAAVRDTVANLRTLTAAMEPPPPWTRTFGDFLGHPIQVDQAAGVAAEAFVDRLFAGRFDPASLRPLSTDIPLPGDYATAILDPDVDPAATPDPDIPTNDAPASDDGDYAIAATAPTGAAPSPGVVLLHRASPEAPWTPVGIFAETILYIDPAHRGRGLSAALVQRAAELRGGAVLLPREGPAHVSPAGFAAMQAAWRQSVTQALAANLPVPANVVADLTAMDRPIPISEADTPVPASTSTPSPVADTPTPSEMESSATTLDALASSAGLPPVAVDEALPPSLPVYHGDRVLHHGSRTFFETPDPARFQQGTNHSAHGQAFYLTDNRALAYTHANADLGRGGPGYVYETALPTPTPDRWLIAAAPVAPALMRRLIDHAAQADDTAGLARALNARDAQDYTGHEALSLIRAHTADDAALTAFMQGADVTGYHSEGTNILAVYDHTAVPPLRVVEYIDAAHPALAEAWTQFLHASYQQATSPGIRAALANDVHAALAGDTIAPARLREIATSLAADTPALAPALATLHQAAAESTQTTQPQTPSISLSANPAAPQGAASPLTVAITTATEAAAILVDTTRDPVERAYAANQAAHAAPPLYAALDRAAPFMPAPETRHHQHAQATQAFVAADRQVTMAFADLYGDTAAPRARAAFESMVAHRDIGTAFDTLTRTPLRFADLFPGAETRAATIGPALRDALDYRATTLTTLTQAASALLPSAWTPSTPEVAAIHADAVAAETAIRSLSAATSLSPGVLIPSAADLFDHEYHLLALQPDDAIATAAVPPAYRDLVANDRARMAVYNTLLDATTSEAIATAAAAVRDAEWAAADHLTVTGETARAQIAATRATDAIRRHTEAVPPPGSNQAYEAETIAIMERLRAETQASRAATPAHDPTFVPPQYTPPVIKPMFSVPFDLEALATNKSPNFSVLNTFIANLARTTTHSDAFAASRVLAVEMVSHARNADGAVTSYDHPMATATAALETASVTRDAASTALDAVIQKVFAKSATARDSILRHIATHGLNSAATHPKPADWGTLAGRHKVLTAGRKAALAAIPDLGPAIRTYALAQHGVDRIQATIDSLDAQRQLPGFAYNHQARDHLTGLFPNVSADRPGSDALARVVATAIDHAARITPEQAAAYDGSPRERGYLQHFSAHGQRQIALRNALLVDAVANPVTVFTAAHAIVVGADTGPAIEIRDPVAVALDTIIRDDAAQAAVRAEQAAHIIAASPTLAAEAQAQGLVAPIKQILAQAAARNVPHTEPEEEAEIDE